MNYARAQALINETKRRTGSVPLFVDESFALQKRLVEQNIRFQAWQATRRAAKSTSAARRILRRVVKKKSKALYLALTLDSAKGILWDEIESQLKHAGVEHSANKQVGVFTLGNGSTIKFAGLDSTYKEMRKLLGQAYAIVVIDETGSMTQDMDTIINQMIVPALTDEMGDLMLIGTAENIPNTYFEAVMSGKIPGWHLEKWDTHSNPYMAKNWAADIERILSTNPLAAKASWFRTHYMNEWCTDDDLRIYTIGEHNLCSSIPKGKATYTIGMDLGWNDATTFVVTAVYDNNPLLYVLESQKEVELDLTATAKIAHKLLDKYPGAAFVVDGSGKQAVEEMRKRKDLALIAAEKTDKTGFMRILRDDLVEGKIQILHKGNEKLIEEAAALMWRKDKDGTVLDEEDPRCQNHVLDALLYSWRKARSYTQEVEVTPWKSVDQKAKEAELKEAEQALLAKQEMSYLL